MSVQKGQFLRKSTSNFQVSIFWSKIAPVIDETANHAKNYSKLHEGLDGGPLSLFSKPSPMQSTVLYFFFSGRKVSFSIKKHQKSKISKFFDKTAKNAKEKPQIARRRRKFSDLLAPKFSSKIFEIFQ